MEFSKKNSAKLLLVLLLIIVTCGFSLTACSSNNSEDDFVDGDTDNGDTDNNEEPSDGDLEDDATETDGDEEEELPDEMGCEVDAQSVDYAQTIQLDPESISLNTEVFTMLIQSGSMTKNEATLWTYAADNLSKRLKVWRESEVADSIELVFDEDVNAEEGYIKHRVSGLAPKTEYYYAFFEQADSEPTGRSMIGRFKTAFPDGCMAPLVIGGTHGTNYAKKPYKALEITATYDLDMFVHLGDYTYNDDAVWKDLNFLDQPSMEKNRELWVKTLDDPGFEALLPTTGLYIVRDDHEICDNMCLENNDFEQEFFYTGMDSLFETTPIEHEDYKLWRSYKWGDTAEIFLLDCRSERVPDSRETEDATYIGALQMEWLKEGLKNSNAHFKIIMNSVPITKFDHPIWFMEFDRWQGYPAQREELLDHIVDSGIENVWWLSGDFHLGSVNRVESSGPYASMWEIMMGPGGNDGNPIWPFVNGELDMYPPEEVVPSQQFDFLYGLKATTIVTFDPIKDTVHILFFDAETGESLYDKEISWEPISAVE